MFEKIRQKIKNCWNWIKSKTKKIILAILGIGVAVAIGVDLIPDKIPFIEIDGQTISFPYTDENSDENFIIRTDKKEYSASNNWDITLYAMVENKSGMGQIINLQLYFPRASTTAKSIEILKENVSHEVIVEDFATTTIQLATSTLIKETKIGEHKETRTENFWESATLSDIDEQVNRIWITKGTLSEKPKPNQRADKQIQTPILNQGISYFKIIIQLPRERIDQEFYIEAVGNEGGYGLLDPTAKTITAYNTAQVDTDYKEFGTGSLLTATSGPDYIDTPNHADFDYDSGNFTIDFWIKRANYNSGRMRVFGQTQSDGTYEVEMYISPTTDLLQWNIRFETNDDRSHLTSLAISNTNWHHVAMVRNANTITVYLDGVPETTPYDVSGLAVQTPTTKFAIGRNGEYNSGYFDGWIDEFRVSKGVARWTANFSASLPTVAYCWDAYTVLLIHADGADGSQVFTDDVSAPAATRSRIIIVE